jgi:hypothetical protein
LPQSHGDESTVRIFFVKADWIIGGSVGTLH